MSEARLLALVRRYPQRRALARRVSAEALGVGLPRLERAGLVVPGREGFRVTARGRRALAFDRLLRRAVERAYAG